MKCTVSYEVSLGYSEKCCCVGDSLLVGAGSVLRVLVRKIYYVVRVIALLMMYCVLDLLM